MRYLSETVSKSCWGSISFYFKHKSQCLIREGRGEGGFCILRSVRYYSRRCLVLVAKRTVEHPSELLLFGYFHFWLRQNKSSLVCHISFTCDQLKVADEKTHQSSAGSLMGELYCTYCTCVLIFCLFVLPFGYCRIVEILQNKQINKQINK